MKFRSSILLSVLFAGSTAIAKPKEPPKVSMQTARKTAPQRYRDPGGR